MARVGHAPHDSKEIVLRRRRIIMETSVATRDDPDSIVAQCVADDSMGDEMAVASEHYNLAGQDVGGIRPVNRDHVAGPKRWQHAGPADAEVQRSAGGERTPAQCDLD